MKMKMLLVASLSISTGVYAGGYRVALQGQNALGMGHAGVAVTESAEVVFFNPASMSELKTKASSMLGVTLINSKIKYQNTLANTFEETDNPIGTPFYTYHTKKVNDKFAIGFAVYTPYGNTVKWPTDWDGSHLINNISLKAVYYQPTISYKMNNKLSIGFGPTLVNGYVEFNRNLSSSLVDGNGDRSNVTIKGTGLTAWGYNAGLLFKPIKPLSVGINYRSRVDLDANGRSVKFDNIPASSLAAFSDTTFNTSLPLPAELTVGIAYNITSNTMLAVDINRTFWSAYDKLDISFNNSLPTSQGPRNYADVNVYRIGLQHKLNRFLILRVGAYLDNTPIKNGYFSPESPRNNSTGLTTGASFAVTKKLDIDASFIYLIFDEFNGSYDFVDHGSTTSTPDTSFGGDYISTVMTFGLGFNYKY